MESALIGVLGLVFEIIPAILGPLPLARQPKSRPFTPCAVVPPSLRGGTESTPARVHTAATRGRRPPDERHRRPQTRLIGGRYRLDASIGQRRHGHRLARPRRVLDRQVARQGGPVPARARRARSRPTCASARCARPGPPPGSATPTSITDLRRRRGGRPALDRDGAASPPRSLSEILREDGPLPPQPRGRDRPRRPRRAGGRARAGHRAPRREAGQRADRPTDGRAVLTDFGIATMAGRPGAHLDRRACSAPPPTCRPERARGKAAGPAVDLWSLGATLYAAAEGRPPFDVGQRPGHPDLGHLRPGAPAVGGRPAGAGRRRAAAEGPAGPCRYRPPVSPRAAAAARGRPHATAPHRSATGGPRPGRGAPSAPSRRRGAAADEPPPPESRPERRRTATRSPATWWPAPRRPRGRPARDRRPGGLRPELPAATPNQQANQLAVVDDVTPSSSRLPRRAPRRPARLRRRRRAGRLPALRGPERVLARRARRLAGDPVQRHRGGHQVPRTAPASCGSTRPPTRRRREEGLGGAGEVELTKELPNYQRISIESVDYNGWDAADWEFTFGDGHPRAQPRLRPDRTTATRSTSPAARRTGARRTRSVFQTAADTFTPAASDRAKGLIARPRRAFSRSRPVGSRQEPPPPPPPPPPDEPPPKPGPARRRRGRRGEGAGRGRGEAVHRVAEVRRVPAVRARRTSRRRLPHRRGRGQRAEHPHPALRLAEHDGVRQVAAEDVLRPPRTAAARPRRCGCTRGTPAPAPAPPSRCAVRAGIRRAEAGTARRRRASARSPTGAQCRRWLSSKVSQPPADGEHEAAGLPAACAPCPGGRGTSPARVTSS